MLPPGRGRGHRPPVTHIRPLEQNGRASSAGEDGPLPAAGGNDGIEAAGLRTERAGNARRRACPRPLAPRRRQHADADPRRLRRRGDQGRAAGGRHAARVADEGRRRPTGRSTRATRRASASSCASPRRASCCCELVPSAAMFVESFRPGTLEEMGLAPDDAARAQSEARHRAHLRLGPGRALPPPARLRHAGRGHVGLRRRSTASPTASRCCRRCTSPTASPGSTARAAAMIALREVEMNGGAGQVIDLPLLDPLFAMLGPAGRQLPADRQGEAAHRQPLDQRGAAQRLPLQGRRATSGLSASTQKMAERAVPRDRPRRARSTIRATAPTPTA